MSKNNQKFAESVEMILREKMAEEFYKAILDPHEHPWLVTDEASLYDITLDEDQDIIEKIYRYYGIKIDQKMLSVKFWKLLDYLNKSRIK